MTVCVFLGPTLSVEAARRILDATYLPPARRGDIAEAIRTYNPHTVALIDGYFEQVPSVWHKELLWALHRGVRTYGSASMGALRAAELAQFGMVGVGKIFDAYVSGIFEPFEDRFEDDDEVAVVHGPEEIGYPATEAMVDIRTTLAEAHRAGLIGKNDMFAIAASAKSLFYKRRTWGEVLQAAEAMGTSGRVLAELKQWLADNLVSQKRLDAEQLLRHLGNGPSEAGLPMFRFERTILWQSSMAETIDWELE